jgi:enoyl-CoA hydratase/carnithine racemase
MTEARVIFERDGAIARVLFCNPGAHNALTLQMWSDLRDHCARIAGDNSIRVVVFRGIGRKAFVSGTDITGFVSFTGGEDGLAYERGIDDCMGAVDALPMPAIAVVDGWAVGGGLNIASACDFRIATPAARFGSPLGRTIGNCLSMSSYARIVSAIGADAARRMLLLGEMLTAQEMLESGFLYRVAEPSQLDAELEALCERAATNAPLTTRVTKEALRRWRNATLPNIDALIAMVYNSDDFKLGVRNFLESGKKPPDWRGS